MAAKLSDQIRQEEKFDSDFFAVKVRKTKKIQILIGFLCKMMSSNVELEFERPWSHQIVRNKAVWNAWTAI